MYFESRCIQLHSGRPPLFMSTVAIEVYCSQMGSLEVVGANGTANFVTQRTNSSHMQLHFAYAIAASHIY